MLENRVHTCECTHAHHTSHSFPPPEVVAVLMGASEGLGVSVDAPGLLFLPR